MALEMQVLVELPISRKRFVVEAIVGPDEKPSLFSCFECGRQPTRAVRMHAFLVWRSQNKHRVAPGMLTWMEAVYEAEEQLGVGKPVCMRCWDESIAPQLAYRAKMP